MKSSKLIILRGPSGSGKSTVAKALFKAATRQTALIEQDHYRFIFKPAGGHINSKTIHEMILQNTLTALNHGYDVILEGIFTVKSYGEIFEALFREHQAENYMFYFDISFEETLKRHATRETAHLFGEKDMRAWYPASGPSKYDFEQIISEQNTVQETLRQIRQAAGV